MIRCSAIGLRLFRDGAPIDDSPILTRMPRDGSLILSDIREPTLSIGCERCGRHGRYNVARLGTAHGDLYAHSQAGRFVLTTPTRG
jgi:hypothetical protein